jgi:hypothetical protein
MLIVAGPQEKRHIPTPQARPATTVGKTPSQTVIDSCVLQLVNDIKALAALEVTHFRQRGVADRLPDVVAQLGWPEQHRGATSAAN